MYLLFCFSLCSSSSVLIQPFCKATPPPKGNNRDFTTPPPSLQQLITVLLSTVYRSSLFLYNITIFLVTIPSCAVVLLRMSRNLVAVSPNQKFYRHTYTLVTTLPSNITDIQVYRFWHILNQLSHRLGSPLSMLNEHVIAKQRNSIMIPRRKQNNKKTLIRTISVSVQSWCVVFVFFFRRVVSFASSFTRSLRFFLSRFSIRCIVLHRHQKSLVV